MIIYFIFMFCMLCVCGLLVYEGHLCPKYFTIGCILSILWPVTLTIGLFGSIVVSILYGLYYIGKWLEMKGERK